jgi:glycosyltransferase involved in cell wall biosynthesis
VPTFSIIIPAYNSESTLLRAVNSVFAQTYSDFEVIIVNDGSIDGTAAVMEEFASDCRIKTFFQTNRGVSAARNAGAELAKSDWLVFLDADDELRDTALDHFSQFTSAPEIWVIRGGYLRRNGESEVVRIPSLKNNVSPLPGSFCLRRTFFWEISGYDDRITFGENTELFHRISLARVVSFYIEDFLFYHYNSKDGASKNRKNMIESTELILEKHKQTLSSHIKYLYHQILGVNYMRFEHYREARKHLLRAWSFRPYKLGALLRLLVAMFPPIARRHYRLPASAR